jgi:hypothetical protein
MGLVAASLSGPDGPQKKAPAFISRSVPVPSSMLATAAR